MNQLPLRRAAPALGIECRVELFHTFGGNAVCYVYNKDGTYRIPPFMLYRDAGQAPAAAEPREAES